MPRMSFMVSGWRHTESFRLRSTWLGAVVERLFEHRVGRREWRREIGSFNFSMPAAATLPTKTGEAA